MDLTHFDDSGAARMVDVSAKEITLRTAAASAQIRMNPATLEKIRAGSIGKGDVCAVARIAGIMGAKQTGALIPLCHPLALDAVEVQFDFPDEQTLAISASVRCQGRTGVEMEALVAVSIAALTVYDMCKSADRGMTILNVQLNQKSGGRSGTYARDATP